MPQILNAQVKSGSGGAGSLPFGFTFPSEDWDTPESLAAFGDFGQWILEWKCNLLGILSQVQIECKSTDMKIHRSKFTCTLENTLLLFFPLWTSSVWKQKYSKINAMCKNLNDSLWKIAPLTWWVSNYSKSFFFSPCYVGFCPNKLF